MPRIFDNIEQHLHSALAETMEVSERADFCVGYFNLRGWRSIDEYVEKWAGGDGHCCRLLVGMQQLPHEELRIANSFAADQGGLDNQTAFRLKKRLAEEFREQLILGAPTNADEAGLRRLAAQIKAKKLVVKLFLKHPLHAKLYLLFRPDPISPTVGYLGSSNLTLSGLSYQGELNIDVLDHDSCQKLATWFEDRWNDRWCVDISKELSEIIEESWAREELIPPHQIYIKMAYHLSQEARAGLTEFRIPKDFDNKLLDFQAAAVKIAAHHLNRRGGVIIGDVVGLGKTLMATALARVFEDDHGLETLILCPKNLVPMWEDYRDQYRMRARVLSITRVINTLRDMRRYRLIVIDESHNLRNREGKRYRAIQEYIRENDSRSYFPTRIPKTIQFEIGDQYFRLFADNVVDAINGLELPRYGLGNYVTPSPNPPPTSTEEKILDDLSRAGKRLMGFCRTNLFKRLESSGHAFLLSVERHILRNFIFLHAIENDLPLPIGTADAGLLDSHSYDEDVEGTTGNIFEEENDDETENVSEAKVLRTEKDFRQRAAEVYTLYASAYRRRFRWVPRSILLKTFAKT